MKLQSLVCLGACACLTACIPELPTQEGVVEIDGASDSDTVKPQPSASVSPKPSASPTPKPSVSASPKPSASPTPTPTATGPAVQHVIGNGSGQLIVNSFPQVKCGDTVGIKAGTYVGIALGNLNGCAGNPITVTNVGGQVKVSATENGHWGFNFSDSSHIVVKSATSGTYGFYISNPIKSRVGFSVAGASNDFDVSGIHVNEASHGISVKEDPDCARPYAWYPFVMRNFNIHDNLIENIRYEGFYLGYYQPNEMQLTCNGVVKTLKASRLANFKVHHNTTKNTGNNGVKLRTCHDGGEIAYNTVLNYGLDKSEGWDSAITMGAETYGSIHHNTIEKGHSTGIDVRTANAGPVRIEANTIIDPGTLPDGSKGQTWVRGILFVITTDGARFEIKDNQVIRPNAGDVEITNYGNKTHSGYICNSGTMLSVPSSVKLSACP